MMAKKAVNFFKKIRLLANYKRFWVLFCSEHVTIREEVENLGKKLRKKGICK